MGEIFTLIIYFVNQFKGLSFAQPMGLGAIVQSLHGFQMATDTGQAILLKDFESIGIGFEDLADGHGWADFL